VTTAIGTYTSTTAVKARIDNGSTTYSADVDALIATLCDQIGSWIEGETGRVMAPIASTTWTFDGWRARYQGRMFPVERGVRTITLLEIADFTGGTFATVPATDYFARPLSQDRLPGWPATEIWMTDQISSGNTRPYFTRGFGTVRITGTFGFDAVPDEIAELATTAVIRAWNARGAGQADIIGTDETGAPVVSRYVSFRDRMTLKRYDAHLKAGSSPIGTGFSR
jgi:hypothetical protein